MKCRFLSSTPVPPHPHKLPTLPRPALPSNSPSKYSSVPQASSTLQLSQLGNRFSISILIQKAFYKQYVIFPPILTCSDWNDHLTAVIYLLNQNELRGELTLHCRTSCCPLSQKRWKLDKVKVIPSVWGYLLRCGNQQNLFSITAATEKKDGFDAHRQLSNWLFPKEKQNGLPAV